MRSKLLALLLVILLSGPGVESFGQSNNTVLFTADSLSSGNYKDVFKSFFQLAFNQLTSDKKEFAFATNPYAIMVKLDSNKLKATDYLKYTFLRRLNISFSGKLNDENRFNGFSSGLKYAIINERDETVSQKFIQQAVSESAEYSNLQQALFGFVTTLTGDDQLAMNDQVNKLFAGTLTYNKLDPRLQAKINETVAQGGYEKVKALMKEDPNFNLRKVLETRYNDLRDLFQKRWLVTLGVSDTTYQERFRFSTVVLSAEILKGISKPDKGVGAEINISGGYNFVNDTLKTGRDLDRRVLQVEPGINLLFNDRNSQSWAEFKISGEYNHVFKGRYQDEEKSLLTLNGTLRVRILKDFWIPLEIKYDPKEGRVFGFLDIRFNFTGFGR